MTETREGTDVVERAAMAHCAMAVDLGLSVTPWDGLRQGDRVVARMCMEAALRTLLSSSRGEQGPLAIALRTLSLIAEGHEKRMPDGTTEVWDVEDAAEVAKSAIAAVQSLTAAPSAPGSVPTSEKEQDARSCTCHPDDNPPVPCPRKYALSECRSADLVRRIRIVLDNNEPLAGYSCKHGIDASLCPMIDCPTPYDRDVILKDVLDLLSVYQAVPTSLAGQGPDGWDRIIATLREFSSLRAADGDYWEADAADRAAKEIERIAREALIAAPQPTAAAGQVPDAILVAAQCKKAMEPLAEEEAAILKASPGGTKDAG